MLLLTMLVVSVLSHLCVGGVCCYGNIAARDMGDRGSRLGGGRGE